MDSTVGIWDIAYQLFKEVWKGEPVRNLGIRVSELCSNEFNQVSLFEDKNADKIRSLDRAIDRIRLRYGSDSIMRGVFLHSGLSPINGGIGEENYPVMTSLL